MNEIIEKDNVLIEDMIYVVNGVEVMLDSKIAVTKYHRNYNKEGSNQ